MATYTTFADCWGRYRHVRLHDCVLCERPSRPRDRCFGVLHVELENLEVMTGEGEKTPPPRQIPTPDAVLMLDASPVALQIRDNDGDGAADGDAWVTPMTSPRLSEEPFQDNSNVCGAVASLCDILFYF